MITRRKAITVGTFAVVGSAVGAPFVVSPSRAQATALKIQGFLPAAAVPQKALEKLAADVAQKSGGKLTIQALPAGGAVAATETLNAVQAGVLDGHYSASSFFAARDAGFMVLGDTGASYDTVDNRDKWWKEGGGEDIARAQYAKFGMHFVAPVYWPAEHIPAKKAVKGVADLKGLKIRVPPGMIAEILSKAGAAVVNIPGGEVFNSLQSGVIDAADWASPSQNNDVGLYRTAKFSIDASHSMPTTDVSIAAAKWTALPAEMKQLLETEVRAMSAALKAELDKLDAEALTKMKADGVEIIKWPKEELEALRKLTAEIQDAQSAKNANAKAVIDSHRAFQKKLGL